MKAVTENRRAAVIAQVLLLAAYAAAILYIGWHHEPWNDEAQAWLIARDSTLSELAFAVKYESSPYLWHLLLKAFIACGLEYRMIFIVPALFCCCGAAILLFGTDIPLLYKGLFLFSFFRLISLPLWHEAIACCFRCLQVLPQFIRSGMTDRFCFLPCLC